MSTMFVNSSDWLHIGTRLLMALLVGCIIGLNRQKGGRPAGIRTFMLVSMGSALFVMIPLQAEGDSPFAATNALSRTIQGVTTGVGFIGAGLILQEAPRETASPRVKGLTTAASVWISAGLGAAIGCGLWQMALMAGVLTLITLSGVKRFNRIIESRSNQKRQASTTSDLDDDF